MNWNAGVISAGFAGLSVLITVGGCARETAAEAGVRSQSLHAALDSDPRDLDPQLATANSEFLVIKALMEGLTEIEPATVRPLPGVAEKWDVSADGLTWTFHLRGDARWSNGDAVTARAFVHGFQRMLTPSLGAEYAPQLHILSGAEAYHSGKESSFNAVGAHALDDHTLVLNLKHPVPYLPSLLALPAWFPAHRATLEKFDAFGKRGTAWTRPENFVGNGAFVLESWRQNQVIRVVRSKTYWDRGKIRLNTAAFYPVENFNTQEAMFRVGQIHVTANALPVEKIAGYRDNPKRAPLLQQGPLLATKFFRFNCDRPPLKDIQVRRALALAIDREALVRRVMQNDLVARAFTPPNCAGYTAEPATRTDIAEARRLLAGAGFPDGSGFPRLEVLFYPRSNSGQPMVEAVQQMWRTNLGIEVAIVQQETKTVLDARRSQNYDILVSDWFGDFVDPVTFLNLWTNGSEHNKTGWSNPEYDRLLAEAGSMLNEPERYATLRRAEALMLSEVPITPLFHLPSTELRHPAVRGWHTNLLATHPLKFVYLQAP